jgi:hypothetical protein
MMNALSRAKRTILNVTQNVIRKRAICSNTERLSKFQTTCYTRLETFIRLLHTTKVRGDEINFALYGT